MRRGCPRRSALFARPAPSWPWAPRWFPHLAISQLRQRPAEPSPRTWRDTMAEPFEYVSKSTLEYRRGYRHAYLGDVPTPVVYGVQGALRFDPRRPHEVEGVNADAIG